MAPGANPSNSPLSGTMNELLNSRSADIRGRRGSTWGGGGGGALVVYQRATPFVLRVVVHADIRGVCVWGGGGGGAAGADTGGFGGLSKSHSFCSERCGTRCETFQLSLSALVTLLPENLFNTFP